MSQYVHRRLDPIGVSVIKPRKTKVVNHIFESLSENIQDSHIKEICSRFAKGKFPRCVYYAGENLCYQKKGKIFSVKVADSDDLPKLVDFLIEHRIGTIVSKQAMFDKFDKNLRDEEKNLYWQSWKSYRKRAIKEDVLYEFVSRKCAEFGISGPRVFRILSLIKCIIQTYKMVDPKDIEVVEGKIERIEGLAIEKDLVRVGDSSWKTD